MSINASLYDDDYDVYTPPSNDEYLYYSPPTRYGSRRPREGFVAKVDNALTKNLAYTVTVLIVIFALVIILWSVTHKKR